MIQKPLKVMRSLTSNFLLFTFESVSWFSSKISKSYTQINGNESSVSHRGHASAWNSFEMLLCAFDVSEVRGTKTVRKLHLAASSSEYQDALKTNNPVKPDISSAVLKDHLRWVHCTYLTTTTNLGAFFGTIPSILIPVEE